MTITPSQFRARIVHDAHADRPDEEMDFMCEIALPDREFDRIDLLCNLIETTKGWEVVADIALTDEDYLPDIWGDEDLRATWLDSLSAELIVQTDILHNGQSLVAHTTPKLCEKLGVSWDNAAKAMAGEVRMFKQWADGDVYGYIIEEGKTCGHCDHTEWEVVDSCFGFYGRDIESNGMLDNVPSDMKEVLLNAEWAN